MMRIKLLQIFCAAMLCTLGTAWALDASGQRYTKMLASGGPGTMSAAAQDIYNTGVNDQEVLDVAAQALTEVYLKNPESRDYADATAWLCKALGNSGNGRYRALLDQVSNAKIHRKTRSYCEKAMAALPKDSGAAFQAGSVDLAAYREGGAKQVAGKPAAPVAAAKPTPASGKKVDFSLVKEGMSQQEVDELLGSPTNQTTYMTGKQFQPFNFGARDVQRTKYLYKGVGHIVFSLKSAYNGIYRVIEIVPDPAETGYP
jgi:hypothetical protein